MVIAIVAQHHPLEVRRIRNECDYKEISECYLSRLIDKGTATDPQFAFDEC